MFKQYYSFPTTLLIVATYKYLWNCIMKYLNNKFFDRVEFLPTRVMGTVYTTGLFVTLFVLDRQVNALNRFYSICKQIEVRS